MAVFERFIPSRRPARVGVALMLSAALLAGCSQEGDSEPSTEAGPPPNTAYFGYQVASRLVTTNAASAFGTASNAHVLSTRLYPAAFVAGPDGQLIPNTDLVATQEIERTPEDQRQIRYTISDKARYSDGEPVVCDDFLLSYTAGSMPPTFGSHLPLMNDIHDLQCEPGSKQFTVVLKQGKGDRWRYMFGAGTVLPSHVIARKVGMTAEELAGTLRSWDSQQLEGIAELWRFGFSLGEFDPEMQVSYGPFVIDHVGSAGEVVLKRNGSYYGDPAELDTLVVWPKSADATHLVETGALRVADSTEGTPRWVKDVPRAGVYEVSSVVGDLTDTLLLAEDGIFANPYARQAFAACVDQQELANVSSIESGTQVPAVYIHALRHTDPIGKQLESVTEPHRSVNLQQAGALRGTTVKVGYLGPDRRYAAMVESLRKSCEPAGITVEDASSDFMSATYLEVSENTGAPTIDAFLGAVDPLTEYATVEARIDKVEDLKKAEEQLWKDIPTIPIAAQPRTFIIDPGVDNVVPYSGLSGMSWNMDRWLAEGPLAPAPESAAETTSSTAAGKGNAGPQESKARM